MSYVSLGMQCTSAQFFRDLNLNQYTMPFDWLLSTPKGVYELLKLLLDDNMPVEELVRNHFCNWDKKVHHHSNYEHFITSDRDDAFLCNSKYNIVFPHDTDTEETYQKFIRRFDRLKKLILSDTKITFVYASRSSLTKGNYTIDNTEVIVDSFLHLTNIFKLLKKHNPYIMMMVFDAIHNEQTDFIDNDFNVINVESTDSWTTILQQLHSYKRLFIQ